MSYNNNYRYKLQSAKDSNHSTQKYTCPKCNKKKCFVRYVDTYNNNAYVSEAVGKCDREANCGYHFKPNDYFKQNPTKEIQTARPVEPPQNKEPQKEPDYISKEIFNQCKDLGNENNNFVIYLKNLFGATITNHLTERYKITCLSKNHYETVVFWQIDNNNNIRTGKTLIYNSQTGKRDKEQPPGFAHCYFKKQVNENYNLLQCLYGEHLITPLKNTVCIVESEKTAIIASVFIPNFIFCATSGATNKVKDKIKSILQTYKGKILLCPDCSIGNKWGKEWGIIATEFKDMGHNVELWDYLENNTTEEQKRQGFDIADVFINQSETELKTAIENYINYFGLATTEPTKPAPEPLFFEANINNNNNNDNDNNTNDCTIKDICNIYNDNLNNNDNTELYKSTPKEAFKTLNINPYQSIINEFENYFNAIPEIKEPIKINDWTTLNGGFKKTVSNRLSTLKDATTERQFNNNIDKLTELKTAIEAYQKKKNNRLNNL